MWNKVEKPLEAVAVISLEKDLSRLELEKSRLADVNNTLEGQKLELERQKFKSEKRWKILSAVGAVASAILSAGVANFLIVPDYRNRSKVDTIQVYEKSNDFLSSSGKENFSQFLKSTRREAWLVGTSFYISLDTYRDELLSKARTGIDFYFIILDPEGPGLSSSALASGLSEQSIKEQCVTGIRSLKSIMDSLQGSGSSGHVFARLSSEPLSSRIYFFDPRSPEGATYLVPYVNFDSSQAVPGFLFLNKSAPFHAMYFEGTSKLWNSERVISLELWLGKHPEFGIK